VDFSGRDIAISRIDPAARAGVCWAWWVLKASIGIAVEGTGFFRRVRIAQVGLNYCDAIKADTAGLRERLISKKIPAMAGHNHRDPSCVLRPNKSMSRKKLSAA
jgi:hypothetical protein